MEIFVCFEPLQGPAHLGQFLRIDLFAPDLGQAFEFGFGFG